MGEVVFWTIIRTAITIPLVWLLQGYLDFNFWWVLSLLLFIVPLFTRQLFITDYLRKRIKIL